MRHFHRTIASLLIAGLSFPGFADDTELYMGQITTATDVPNILFVLDRSSSMGSTVSGPEAPVLGGTRRFDHLRDALLLLLPGLNNVNVGFMTFTQYFESEVAPEEPVHYNIPLRFPIIHIDTLLDDVPEQPGTWAEGTTVRDYLYDMITNLGYHEGTPLVPAILEAGMYYTGGNLLYGDNRRNNAANRVAHPGAYTGGTVVRDAGCTDGDLGAIACQTEKIEGTPVYNQPTIGQCQQNYIVFLTDGEATQTDIYTQNAIKTFAGITNCEGSGNEICGVDMVRALYETDLAPALPGLQNVITHTIAFALEAESGRDYMQQWANAGGGNFYAADNALELLAAFQQILGSIITESTSFAAPSLSMNAFNRLDQDNQVYFALFKPELTASWDGNVKKYNICDDDDTCGVVGKILDANANPAMNSENKIRNGCGTEACGDPYVALDLWNPTPADRDGGKVHKGGTGGVLLQSVQADPINRKIYTDINGTLTEIVTANRSTLRAELGVSTDAEAETLINWIRGYQDGDPSAGVREWLLDDSLHGSPGAITIGEDESENPITKIFMTTNEGAIRMLNGETGAEEWMFIPREMLSIQQTLMENPTTTNRTYGIDGNIAFIVHDENKDEAINPTDGDTVKLFVGMRRGGRNIYALDVTPDTSGNHQPSLLWTIKGGTGDFVRLGQTWSMPKPTKVRFGAVSKTVLLFGGGYEPDTQDDPDTYSSVSAYSNAIYMVDPENGTRLWWASKTGSGADLELTGMDYSIPSDLTLMDSTGDGFTDRLYVGDTGGQVWRIDLDTGIGGRLASVGGTEVSDKRRFFYPPQVVKLTDSKYTPEGYSDYDLVLIGSGHRPNPLGTDIQDRLYALRDRAIHGLTDSDEDGNAEMDNPENPPIYHFFTLIHEMDDITDQEKYLFDATANLIQDGDNAQKTAALESLQGTYGWYIDLDRLGEKNLSAPLVVLGVAYFTTFVPPTIDASTDCVIAEGSGWIYALDILTGAAVNPDYDETNGAQIEKSDRRKKIGDGIPSKVVPIIIGHKVVLLTGSGGGIYSENVPLGGNSGGFGRILYWIKE